MADEPRPSDFAREGLELWEAGDLELAEGKYRDALSRLSAEHWGQPHVRAQLAGVLAARGHNQEAREQFEIALQEELVLANDDSSSPAVRACRYFLGEHLVRMGEPGLALSVIGPALGKSGDFILRFVEADAQHALGRSAGALAALRCALEAATTDHQRQEVQARLSRIQETREPSKAVSANRRLQPTSAPPEPVLDSRIFGRARG